MRPTDNWALVHGNLGFLPSGAVAIDQAPRWWSDDPEERYWLEITGRDDIGRNLNAPEHGDGGKTPWHWKLVTEAEEGDIVFHYSKEAHAIVGLSQIVGEPQYEPVIWKSPDPRPGVIRHVSGYRDLDNPVSLATIRAHETDVLAIRQAIRQEHGDPVCFPFAAYGNGPLRPIEGYLAKMPQGLVAVLGLENEDEGISGPPKRRNPNWGDEELILALDLYLQLGQLGHASTEVVELSETLNRLTLHSERPDSQTFRNPNGVALKLANFAALDPAYPGKGMDRGGRGDARIWDEFHGDNDAVAEAAARIRRQLPWRAPDELPFPQPRVQRRPLENLLTRRFDIHRTGGRNQGERRELVLVHDYASWLGDLGHSVCEHRYPIPGIRGVLWCDLFDETDNVLYEAKASTGREQIRMAVGQLYDYRRFEPDTTKIAALLPRRPPPDLVDYLHACGVGMAYRTDDGFSVSLVERK